MARWEKPAGNWNDPNIKNHTVPDGSLADGAHAGETWMSKPKGTANDDGSVSISSRLDWYVEEHYKLTKVSLAEINDHVRGWRNWQNELWGEKPIRQFKTEGQTAKSVAAAFERKYRGEWAAQRGAQSAFDNPLSGSHSISRNPELKKSVSAAEIEQAVGSLP